MGGIICEYEHLTGEHHNQTSELIINAKEYSKL